MPTRGNVIVLPFQVRMARGALNWTVRDLAEYAGVGEKSVRRFEGSADALKMSVATYDAIIKCLEDSGIVFVPGCDTIGPGVRYTQS